MTISPFTATVASLLERPASTIAVQLISTAFLQSGGKPVGVFEAGPTELAAIRLIVGRRRLTIPVRLDMLEAIECDPAGDTASDIALALAEAWGSRWSWASNPTATRVWCDPFDLNDDALLVSPTIR